MGRFRDIVASQAADMFDHDAKCSSMGSGMELVNKSDLSGTPGAVTSRRNFDLRNFVNLCPALPLDAFRSPSGVIPRADHYHCPTALVETDAPRSRLGNRSRNLGNPLALNSFSSSRRKITPPNWVFGSAFSADRRGGHFVRDQNEMAASLKRRDRIV